MALSIEDPKIESLARDLAARTGESVAVATRRALEERIRRVATDAERKRLLDDLAASRKRWAKMPIVDDRSEDEILGYDANGLPSR